MGIQKHESEDRVSFFRRIADFLFGYDFFISYCWADGRQYAVALQNRLNALGFNCFLDSSDYAKGDNWRQQGRRALKKTSRLILVGTPKALESEPVANELRIFSELGRRVLPIDFGGTLSKSGSPEGILPFLDPEILRVNEPPEALLSGPSSTALTEIQESFNLLRQDQVRVRWFAGATAVFAIVAAVAIMLGVLAESRRHVAIQKTREVQENLTTNNMTLGEIALKENRPEEAVWFFWRAVASAPENDPRITSALRLVGAWGIPAGATIREVTEDGDPNATRELFSVRTAEFEGVVHRIKGWYLNEGDSPKAESAIRQSTLRWDTRKPTLVGVPMSIGSSGQLFEAETAHENLCPIREGDGSRNVVLFDGLTGSEIERLSVPFDFDDVVVANGGALLVKDSEGEIVNLKSGARLGSFGGRMPPLSSNGRFVLSAMNDGGGLQIRDVRNGRSSGVTLPIALESIGSPQVAPDGGSVVLSRHTELGSRGYEIWDFQTSGTARRLWNDTEHYFDLIFDRTGRWLATRFLGDNIEVLSMASGLDESWGFSVNKPVAFRCKLPFDGGGGMAFTVDREGFPILIADDGKNLCFRRIASSFEMAGDVVDAERSSGIPFKEPFAPQRNAPSATQTLVSPCGRWRLEIGGQFGHHLQMFEMASDRLLHERRLDDRLEFVVFAPDGDTYMTTSGGSADTYFHWVTRYWDTYTGLPLCKPIETMDEQKSTISADGKWALTKVGILPEPDAHQRIWRLPEAAAASSERLQITVELYTGFIAGTGGQRRVMTLAERRDHLARLDELGGPAFKVLRASPEIEPEYLASIVERSDVRTPSSEGSDEPGLAGWVIQHFPSLVNSPPPPQKHKRFTLMRNVGITGLYKTYESVFNLALVESLLENELFIEGPHLGGIPNMRSARTFGHYNPDAIIEISAELDRILANESFVEATRPFYDARLKDISRGFYRAFKDWQDDPRSFAKAKETLLSNIVRDSDDWFSAPAADAGFWVRRSIDGTDRMFFSMLSKVIKVYDADLDID